MTFSKSAQLSRPKPKSKRPTRDVKAFFDFVAGQGCVVPRCPNPASLHHLPNAVSLKTRQPLKRRSGLAQVCVVPMCAHHHQHSVASVHSLGERLFEQAEGLPEGFLRDYAMSLLAAFIYGVADD